MGKHKKLFLIIRIVGSTVNVIASGVALVGLAAVPFTGGASASIVGAATGVAWIGGMTSALVSLIQCVLEIEGTNVVNALLKIVTQEHLSPGRRLELVSEFFKEIIRAAEGAGMTSATAAACKTVSNAERIQNLTKLTEMIDYLRASPLARVNGLSLLVGTVDLITASLQLHQMEGSS